MPNDYERKMHEDLKDLMSKYPYTKEDQAFVHWCLKTISNITDDDTIAEAYTNGSNDLGIDGILILDGDPVEVHFIQAKLVTGEIPRKDVREFIDSSLKIISDPEFHKRGNKPIIRLGKEVQDITSDNSNVKIVLHYCNFGTYADNAIDELKDWIKTFTTDGAYTNYELKYYTKDTLLTAYRSNFTEKITPPDAELPIINEKILDYEGDVYVDPSKNEKAKRRTIVFITKASEIGKLTKNHGKSLFSINVRYSLGIDYNQINKEMLNTLQNEKWRDKFLFFNNGVYAICKKFDPPSNGKINIEGIQIVNGCQTCTVLGEAVNQGINLDNVNILIRLVEGKDENLIADISKYTNTQNAVKARDLHANDAIQSRLFDDFQNNKFWGKKYFYQRKTGEFDHYKSNKSKKMWWGRNIIDNKDVAQAIFAFYLQKPSRAKASADILFYADYKTMFKEMIEASTLFYCWYALQIVKEFIKNEKKKLNQDYLPQGKFSLLAMVAYCFTKKYGKNVDSLPEEFDKMSKSDGFDKDISYYLNQCLQVLNGEARNSYGKPIDVNFDARKFFLDSNLLNNRLIPALDSWMEGLAKASGRKNIWSPP